MNNFNNFPVKYKTLMILIFKIVSSVTQDNYKITKCWAQNSKSICCNISSYFLKPALTCLITHIQQHVIHTISISDSLSDSYQITNIIYFCFFLTTSGYLLHCCAQKLCCKIHQMKKLPHNQNWEKIHKNHSSLNRHKDISQFSQNTV